MATIAAPPAEVIIYSEPAVLWRFAGGSWRNPLYGQARLLQHHETGQMRLEHWRQGVLEFDVILRVFARLPLSVLVPGISESGGGFAWVWLGFEPVNPTVILRASPVRLTYMLRDDDVADSLRAAEEGRTVAAAVVAPANPREQ